MNNRIANSLNRARGEIRARLDSRADHMKADSLIHVDLANFELAEQCQQFSEMLEGGWSAENMGSIRELPRAARLLGEAEKICDDLDAAEIRWRLARQERRDFQEMNFPRDFIAAKSAWENSARVALGKIQRPWLRKLNAAIKIIETAAAQEWEFGHPAA